MTHRIRIILLAAGTALAALASPSIALAQTKLIGTVADPGTITLRTEAGAAVTDVPAGTYTIEVRDQSINHNFHLSGPGVDQRTDVETIETQTWTVTLQNRARYAFVCDPHNLVMRGSFTTGGGPPTPPPPPTTRPPTLTATVGPGATISLRTSRGARVTRPKAGRYRIVVRDRSRMHNFHLFGAGVNKRTTVRFRGSTTWTVTFRKGRTYRFVCDPHATRMKGSFRAT
ncbi:MAG: plastocyanin/azurin family copper-binding protein [Gaiellaceae bacterium]